MSDDNPPEGFLRIDFDRGGPVTFNAHIGNLYCKRGPKGTRDEFVLGFRVQQTMVIRASRERISRPVR